MVTRFRVIIGITTFKVVISFASHANAIARDNSVDQDYDRFMISVIIFLVGELGGL